MPTHTDSGKQLYQIQFNEMFLMQNTHIKHNQQWTEINNNNDELKP